MAASRGSLLKSMGYGTLPPGKMQKIEVGRGSDGKSCGPGVEISPIALHLSSQIGQGNEIKIIRPSKPLEAQKKWGWVPSWVPSPSKFFLKGVQD